MTDVDADSDADVGMHSVSVDEGATITIEDWEVAAMEAALQSLVAGGTVTAPVSSGGGAMWGVYCDGEWGEWGV